MHSVMPSGLSVPVAWAFCSGMNYADPVENAREHIRRFTELPLGSIQTVEDIDAIQYVLKKWLPLLPKEEVTPAMKLLLSLDVSSLK